MKRCTHGTGKKAIVQMSSWIKLFMNNVNRVAVLTCAWEYDVDNIY